MEEETNNTEYREEADLLTPTDAAEETVTENGDTPLPETEAEEAPPQERAEEVPPSDDGARFAELERADLAVLAESFPSMRGSSSLLSLKNPARYGELRELGLTPTEAYLASEGLPRERAGDSRAHLAPSLGRSARPTGGRISVGEMEAARDLFPSLSDREIEALWRRCAGSLGHVY